jgi:4-amino-4-deoxy-L-arabinose transferase-like glycosyltransferase
MLARRIGMAWLALAAVAFVAVRVPFLDVPLERDEGEYAYIAWRMLEGDVPYRDAFDQKPPGVFAAYAAAFLLFGRTVEGIRLFLHLWTAATALVLFACARRLSGSLAGAGAVLLFAVLSADPRVGATSANTELFLLLPMTGALWCWLRSEAGARPRAWLAVAGALAAMACWFKPVAATNGLHLVWLAAFPRGGRAGSSAGRLFALGFGAAAASAAVLVPLAACGALGELMDAVVLHNLVYASQRSFAEGLDNLVSALLDQIPSFAVAWLLAGFGLAAAPRAARPVLAGWLAASAAGAAIGLQFRPHYFVQVLPPLAALGGIALAAAVRRVGSSPARAALAGALLAVLAVTPPVAANRAALFAVSPEAAARELWGLNPFLESREIAEYIARTSGPEDTVFVVGSEPQIPFYAARRSASRYIIFYPLTGRFDRALERQREVVDEVARAQPLYVVWAQVPTSLLLSAESERLVFEATSDLLARAYQIELVAQVEPDGLDWELLHGSEARRWADAGGAQRAERPWLAVYRRRAPLLR